MIRCRDIPHRLDGVREDDFLVRITLGLVVPAVVDELHLLEHSRLEGIQQDICRARQALHLSGLSGTQEQHLYLVLGQHAVPLELALDLVIAWGSLWVRRRATKSSRTYGPLPLRRRRMTERSPF